MGDENDNVIQLHTLRRRKRWAEVGNAIWTSFTNKQFSLLYMMVMTAAFVIGGKVADHFHQKSLNQCLVVCKNNGAKLLSYDISEDSCNCVKDK